MPMLHPCDTLVSGMLNLLTLSAVVQPFSPFGFAIDVPGDSVGTRKITAALFMRLLSADNTGGALLRGFSMSIRGLGGLFIYARDARQLVEWYRAHLGIEFAFEASE